MRYVVGRIVSDASPRIAAPMAKIVQVLFLAGLAVLAVVVIARGLPALAELVTPGVPEQRVTFALVGAFVVLRGVALLPFELLFAR